MGFDRPSACLEQRCDHGRSASVKSPESLSIRELECYGEVFKKLAAGDIFGAERRDVRRWLLTVEDLKSPGLELSYERDQGDL